MRPAFDWDEANLRHIALHDVTPGEAEYVFLHLPLLLHKELREREERFVHLGTTDKERVLVVVVTMREERVRIVTAFPAPLKLRRYYHSLRKRYGRQIEDA